MKSNNIGISEFILGAYPSLSLGGLLSQFSTLPEKYIPNGFATPVESSTGLFDSGLAATAIADHTFALQGWAKWPAANSISTTISTFTAG